MELTDKVKKRKENTSETAEKELEEPYIHLPVIKNIL